MSGVPLTRRHGCRLCGSGRLAPVLSLAPTPPANAFVRREALGTVQPCFPLDVHLCADCGHAQLLDVVDPRLLFEDYVYVSGTSPVFVRHFEEYCRNVLALAGLRAPGLVVDIGSNDGTLLRFFAAAGHRVLGIDPAREIARQATADGIETIPAFLDGALARQIRAERGAAEVVCANNVFAHIDDLRGATEAVRTLLAPGGLFVFEVSYLLDVIEKCLFDTIYHEHLSYHSVQPLVGFFRSAGMELIEAQRVASHGGSLRGIAQLAGGPRTVGPGVAAAVAAEERAGLAEPATFAAFGARIGALGEQLRSFLAEARAAGKRVAGFGAPAKATTLLHHFGLGREALEFIVDDSPLKQGLYTPGTHIPVLPSEAIYARRPDFLVILAWNFAEAIMAKHAAFREAGGRFVVPVPAFSVH